MADVNENLDEHLELEEHPEDPDIIPAEPQAPADARDEQIRALQQERDTLFERLARAQAEFENQRKRAAREQAEFRDFAVTEAVRLLIPVLDNFDLALRSNTSGEDLRKGVELIRKQLEDALGKLGVTAVPAAGQQFDPRIHEAIEVVETSNAEDNHVVEELQPGYKLKDRLIRPAMVKVARNRS